MLSSPGEGKGYVNAAQAARLMGITARHVYRLIENGNLVARHKNKRRLEIALADVEAWIEAHPQEGDPLEQLKSVQEQLKEVSKHINALETQFDVFKASTQEELAALREEIQRGDLQEALNHLLAFLSRFSAQEYQQETQGIDTNGSILSLPRSHIDLQERIRRSLSALERRQLPSGTVTVASFAKKHSMKPRTALGHCKKNQAFTLYHRPKAKILRHEWWITPEQQALLIRYWKQRQFQYEECQQCPHENSIESKHK
jgi:excisionase family DNA binding protein